MNAKTKEKRQWAEYKLPFLFFLSLLLLFVDIFPLTNWKWVALAVCYQLTYSLCKVLYLFVITPLGYCLRQCFGGAVAGDGASETNQPRNENKRKPMNRTMDSLFSSTAEHLKCFTCNTHILIEYPLPHTHKLTALIFFSSSLFSLWCKNIAENKREKLNVDVDGDETRKQWIQVLINLAAVLKHGSFQKWIKISEMRWNWFRVRLKKYYIPLHCSE